MLTIIDNDDGNDDVHTVAADDDEDDERATEKPTQSINSYNADQKENNIAMADSYATVEIFNKPDVNKLLLLCDDEKLNFPTTNKMQKKVLIKKFPLVHANQNVEEKAQKLPTYKCLAQLHNDISMLRSCNVQRTTTSTEELRKFPLSQGIRMQGRRCSFPCQLLQEVDIKSGEHTEHIAIAALCVPSVHSFPTNASFKDAIATKVSLKRFPTVWSKPNVNKTPQLTEFKCLAQLHTHISALRSHFSTPSTASTEDIGKFPLYQSLHMQNRRRCTFPCTSLQARELFNDMTTVGALKSDVKLPVTDVLCVQPVLRLPLPATSETLQKFPLKLLNQINNKRNLKLTEVKGKQHFPVVICRGQMLDTAETVGHSSCNKSKLHIADLTVFHKKAGLEDIAVASAYNLEPLYYSSFPYISMTKSAKFPILKNTSLDLAIPLHSVHTTQPYRNQNYDHRREIQVQLNQEQLELETTANSQMLEHSNYYLEQEQHINDAINLASVGATTAITKAKYTTESSSSQKNDGVDGDHHDDDDDDDESNISVGIGGESTQMNINNSHNNDSDEQYFPYTVTPPPPSSTPPTLENLELLVSYTIESAANHHNHHHRILSTSSLPCSDVRDSSSQEVPSPLNVNVSCSEERLTKETRPFFLEENAEAAASSTDLVTLPKYYDLNNTEVHEDLIENSRFATLSARVHANVQNTKRSQETEIVQGIIDEAMTLTEIEDSEILSEYTDSNSALDDNLNQQDIVGIEEQQSNEMKLEMKSARGSILSADAEATARRYTQLKNEQNLTNTRRSSVNTYGGVGKPLSVGSNLTRSQEILARNAQAPIENPQRRHSVKGNSTIGYKLGTTNDIAAASATDRNTLKGTTLSGSALTNSAPTMTSSAGRNSLTGRTSRTNDAHVTDRINLKEPVLSSGTIKRNSLASSLARANDILATDRTTSLRESALAATTTPATTVDSLRRSSLTSSILRPSDTSAIVAATVDNSLTNISPKKYNRAPTKYVPSQESNDVTRSISLDAADSVLPARTLLRRQRRMRPQSSYDEPPESAIERLNRLRARISGALSEVKGVLKHYSTDAEEADAETEAPSALKAPTITAQEQQVPENVLKQSVELKAIEEQPALEKKEDGPVTFRFVKKVRRRSLFDEEEEDKEKARHAEVAAEIKPSNEVDAGTQKAVDSSSEKTKQDIEHVNKATNRSRQVLEVSSDTANKINTAEERNQSEISENKPETSLSEISETKAELEIEPQKTLPRDNFSTETTEQLEDAKSNAVTEGTPKIKTKLKKKTSATQTADGDQPKRSIRRASIAAVESSKIEPTIKNLIPLDIIKQRRPSDSEAIIKKKSAKLKTTNVANETDGDESMPKVKSINKVKRPSLKRANIATTTQVTTETTTNAMTDNTKSTLATIEKINSSIVEMQANNSNKDAPKTAPAAATLATQLVIDDASLTIGQATVAIDDDSSKATKEALASDTATIATTLVSPLRTSEQSSQVKKSPTESQKLTAELLAETPIIVVDTKRKSLETVSTEKQLLDQLEIAKVRVEGVPALTKEFTAEKEQNEIAAESKKLINQKVLLTKVDTIDEQVRRTPTPENQQVNAEILKAPASIAAVVNNVITESTTESITTTTTSDALLSPLSVEATKAKATSTTTHSSTATGTSEASSAEAMPELQVKAAQVFIEPKELLETKEPFNILKENVPKKKAVILKKLVRKNSTEKSQANNKTDAIKLPTLAANIKDKSKKDAVVDTIKKVDDEIPTAIDEEIATIDEVEEQNEETVEEPPAPEKKKRKIKKKVIIKRQQRRLSISENTFFKTAEEEPTSPIEDIVEKPIEYVKVASDEEQDYEEIPTSMKPTKSCLKVREFQVGDLVMYAERYKKTQVRWKRGKVLERITSISYKLEIEGKEVPAHISYIKKYTGRKVNFGGKEYLEIDYEQIAEEEQKARAYSIWNMV